MGNSESVRKKESEMFSVGNIIDNNYKIIKRIGRGGYGETYSAKNIRDGKVVAIKVKKMNTPGNLAVEKHILKELRGRSLRIKHEKRIIPLYIFSIIDPVKILWINNFYKLQNRSPLHISNSGARYVPTIESSGFHNGKVHYIVMNLLGESISTIRRNEHKNRFSYHTTALLGIQMLKAIKQVHDHGYLHRDIKPGNFLMGPAENPRQVYIIDFGLSRKHIRRDGSIRAERDYAKWVGSRRYMSPNTHNRKDQGRRDDLWSFLYVIIELATGNLPWDYVKSTDKLEHITEIKMKYANIKLTDSLPHQYKNILNHILTLGYADRPDYQYMNRQLKDLYIAEGGDLLDPSYEWERLSVLENPSRLSFGSINFLDLSSVNNSLKNLSLTKSDISVNTETSIDINHEIPFNSQSLDSDEESTSKKLSKIQLKTSESYSSINLEIQKSNSKPLTTSNKKSMHCAIQ